MIAHLVTFSDESMSRSRDLCVRSALKHGIDNYHAFTLWDIDPIATQHPEIFKAARGCGYWAWKPYLIDRLTGADSFVHGADEGDVIVYTDAGVEFINRVSHIINRMDQDIFLFGNNWEHAHWCKRDVVEAVWPLPYAATFYPRATGWEAFGKQVQASVIFFRVSDYTRTFVKEWLDWCLFEGGRLIDDSPSRLPNHPEFQEHRHDQAILTTMAYREGIKLHYWPAMYNDGAFSYERLPCYAGDDYPILFHHHRRRNHEWK